MPPPGPCLHSISNRPIARASISGCTTPRSPAVFLLLGRYWDESLSEQCSFQSGPTWKSETFRNNVWNVQVCQGKQLQLMAMLDKQRVTAVGTTDQHICEPGSIISKSGGPGPHKSSASKARRSSKRRSWVGSSLLNQRQKLSFRTCQHHSLYIVLWFSWESSSWSKRWELLISDTRL